MDICDIRSGIRVLFKLPYDTNPQWKVGIIGHGAKLMKKN